MKKNIIIFCLFLPLLLSAQSKEEQLLEQAKSYYNAKEYEKAYPLYLEQANNGNAEAQCFMGHYYYFGYAPMEKNYAEAYCWYLKSSRQGNKIALNNLGAMYENGEYVMQDYEKAYQYYMNAVERGNAFSAKNIGRLFHQRLLYPDLKCYEETAEKWYKQAALLDSADGIYWLAGFYSDIILEIIDSPYDYAWNCHKSNLSSEERYALGQTTLDSLRIISDSLSDLAAKNGSIDAQIGKGSYCFSHEKYEDALYWFTLAKKNGTKYVPIDVDTYPIDIAIVLMKFLKDNPNIHYAIRPMNGSAAPKDENWTITTDKGYFEFLMREGDDWHIGSVRLSLDGKILFKHPAIHNNGWYDEEKNTLFFDEDEGGTSGGVSPY